MDSNSGCVFHLELRNVLINDKVLVLNEITTLANRDGSHNPILGDALVMLIVNESYSWEATLVNVNALQRWGVDVVVNLLVRLVQVLVIGSKFPDFYNC